MENSNNLQCDWNEGCENKATKFVTYNYKAGETVSGSFPISFVKANVCDFHLTELQKLHTDAREQKIRD